MEDKIPQVDISKDTIEIKDASKKHYDDKNEVTVVGTLIKKTETNNGYLLSVMTTAGRDRDLVSFVTVKVSKDDEYVKTVKEKTRVEVKGILRNRPVFTHGRDEKPEYIPYVQASVVSDAKSAMEEAFGIKGRSFGESYNKVILTGTVTRMVQLNRFSARITIRTQEEDKKERIVETVFFARNNLKKLLPMLAIGNKVCAIAEIQNYRKLPGKSYTVNGKVITKQTDITQDAGESPVYVHNVVILDINEV